MARHTVDTVLRVCGESVQLIHGEILGAVLKRKGRAEGKSFQPIQPNFIASTLSTVPGACLPTWCCTCIRVSYTVQVYIDVYMKFPMRVTMCALCPVCHCTPKYRDCRVVCVCVVVRSASCSCYQHPLPQTTTWANSCCIRACMQTSKRGNR